MSRKFVPSFLKEQSAAGGAGSAGGEPVQTRTFINTNRFAPLSDDKHINTSRPAKEAPKLVPATLASITSNGTGGKGGTYASKMAERAKMAANPNYVPPPKPVDVTSENEFPSLGGAPKKVDSPKIDSGVKKSGSFASLARDWAKQKEEEEEEEKMIRMRLEEEERELRLLRSMVAVGRRKKNATDYTLEGEEEDQYDESSLGGDSDNEMPEDSEPSEEEEEEEDEYNQNVGWDGRRRDDLY